MRKLNLFVKLANQIVVKTVSMALIRGFFFFFMSFKKSLVKVNPNVFK